MNLTFVNGNQQQQDACRFVANHLLNLPPSAVPLQLTIEFISDPDPSKHNEFAITEFTYGSVKATTKIGKVAPNWGKPYRGIRFLNETFAHELGHALFAMMAEKYRVAIAALFGAKSDKLAELQPVGSKWEDRIIEGIAETFKDAFLSARFRLYSNRTNKKIPISKYPEFRRLFREGIETTGGSGTPLPAYNLDVYKQYKASENLQVYEPLPSEDLFFGGTFFKGTYDGGLYQQIEGWEPLYEASDNYLYKQYRANSVTETLLVPRGTHFGGSIILPQDLEFFGPSSEPTEEGAFGAHYGEGGFAGAYTWEEINKNKELEDPFGPFEQPFAERIMGIVSASIWFTFWNPATKTWVCWDYRNGSILGFEPIYKFGNPHPKFPGPTSEKTGCWIIMKGDGRPNVINEGDKWSIPIGTISLGSNVPGTAPTTTTCGGDMVQVRIFAKVTLKAAPSRQASLATIQSRLPSFTLNTDGAPCKGSNITLPTPSLEPLGWRGGGRPKRRRVSGGRGR